MTSFTDRAAAVPAIPAVLAVLAFAACAPDREVPAEMPRPATSPDEQVEASAAACEPIDAAPLGGVEPESLAGDYRLVVVATSGPAAGARVEETLRLRLQDPALRELVGPDGRPFSTTATLVLIGSLSGDLAEVAALVPGDPASDAPEAPGVAVLFISAPGAGPPGPERILLRLGAEANVRGRLAFDDAFTVLRVSRVEDRTFFGTWESGGPGPGPGAGGHFCALR